MNIHKLKFLQHLCNNQQIRKTISFLFFHILRSTSQRCGQQHGLSGYYFFAPFLGRSTDNFGTASVFFLGVPQLRLRTAGPVEVCLCPDSWMASGICQNDSLRLLESMGCISIKMRTSKLETTAIDFYNILKISLYTLGNSQLKE